VRLVTRRATTLVGAAVLALPLAAGPLAAGPALADDGPGPCTVADAPATVADPAGWTFAGGHAWTAGGLTLAPDGGSAAVAAHAVDMALADAATIGAAYAAPPSAEPTVVLTVDLGDGTSTTLSARAPISGTTEWLLAGDAPQGVVDASPESTDAGHQGTAAQWATALPAAHVTEVDLSAGPAAADAATLASVTAGCTRYTFGPASLGTPVVTLPAAKVGARLTPTVSGWSATPDTVTYAWTSGSTTSHAATYTPVAADAGRTLSLVVTGSKAGYADAVSAPVSTVVATADFAGSPNPTLSGTVRVGATVTARLGTWSPAPTKVAYQWRVDGKPVTGATAATFVPRATDAGHKLTVGVTATLAGYATLVRSSAAATVGHGIFTAARPTISGSSQVGSRLTLHRGAWSPAATTYTYQWLRSGAAIKGATRSTYTVAKADAGRSISVRVTGRAAGFSTKVVTSASVKATVPFRAIHVPTVTGTTRVGSKLTAHVVAWSPLATLHYQWKRNGTSISGATGSTYTLTRADHGAALTVAVTGTRSGYTTRTTTSRATAKVAWPVGVTTPRITKQPTWSPVRMNASTTFAVTATGGSLHYQWQYSSDGGATWKTYAGKTSAKLTVTATSARSLFQYRVRVSNVVTTVTSRAVLLGIVSTQAAPFGVDAPFLLDMWGAQVEKTEDLGAFDASHHVVGAATYACYEGSGSMRPGSSALAIRIRVGSSEYDGGAVVGDVSDDIGSVDELATGKCAWFRSYAVVPTSVLRSSAFDKAVWAVTDNTRSTNFTQYVTVG
jgi:hypothetical protein